MTYNSRKYGPLSHLNKDWSRNQDNLQKKQSGKNLGKFSKLWKSGQNWLSAPLWRVITCSTSNQNWSSNAQMIDLAMNYKSLNIIEVQIFMDFKMQVHQNQGKPKLDFLHLEKFLSVWQFFLYQLHGHFSPTSKMNQWKWWTSNLKRDISAFQSHQPHLKSLLEQEVTSPWTWHATSCLHIT